MLGTQIGAFATAFSELWGRQDQAERALADCRVRWWSYLWGFVAWVFLAVSVHLILRSDNTLLGWILLGWPQAWLSMQLVRQFRARVALREIGDAGWQDFNLRFQWRAFGLTEDSIHHLKRLWASWGGRLDLRSDEYRAWHAEAVHHARDVAGLT